MRQLWHKAEMARVIVFISMVLFSVQSFAKDECLLRLSNPLPHAPESERAFEQQWIETLGGSLSDEPYSKWSPGNILQRWTSWRSLTRNQRDQAYTLELMKISPAEMATQQTVQMLGRDDLKALSAKNKERMVQQLDVLFPVNAAGLANEELQKTAKQVAARAQFSYSRPVNPIQFNKSPEGYDAPIASPRELAALDLDKLKTFYSSLVGNSPSVEFTTLASKIERGGLLPEFATYLRRETYVLQPRFARENGFSLPSFRNAFDMLDFFDFWDPQAGPELFRASWTSLPKGTRTYAQFRAYVKGNAENFEFNSYQQLAPLRSRLYQYVMTAEDLDDFLKQALRRYIHSLGSVNAPEAQTLADSLTNSGNMLRFFREKLFPALHIPSGIVLRIPVAVSAKDYILSRVSDAPVFPRPATYPSMRGPFFDPRTIDHDTKP
jgi:hypothetical protein